MTQLKDSVRPSYIENLVLQTRTGKRDNHDKLSRCGKKGGETAAINNLVFRFKKANWQQQVLDDAKAHAEANRAGWDDDYDPLDS